MVGTPTSFADSRRCYYGTGLLIPTGIIEPKILEVRWWCVTFKTQVGTIIAMNSGIGVAFRRVMDMVNSILCS